MRYAASCAHGTSLENEDIPMGHIQDIFKISSWGIFKRCPMGDIMIYHDSLRDAPIS